MSILSKQTIDQERGERSLYLLNTCHWTADLLCAFNYSLRQTCYSHLTNKETNSKRESI
jgi:hypothetical protein